VLNRSLPTRKASTEPQSKRSKADTNTGVSTILTRASSGEYSSLDDVISDVKVAATAVYEELRLPSSAARTQYTPIPPEASELASKVVIFRKRAEEILQKDRALEGHKAAEQSDKVSEDSKALINGALSSKTYTQLSTGSEDNRLVLTLFANAPGPKQLFSSLQETLRISDGRTDVTQPLREAGLPFGISTTQVIPVQPGFIEEKKRAPTIGELFSTPTSTLPFLPPKPSRNTKTRSEVVGWYQPSGLETGRIASNQSYYGQNIKTGHPLEYTGAVGFLDAKRKQRQRALSLSGVKPGVSTDDTAEQEAAKLDALFRSAYSGFAPSKDDAAAIVPEGLVNRVWWQRMGERNFQRLVRNAVNVDEIASSDLNAAEEVSTISDKELEELEKVIEHWNEDAIDPTLDESTSGSKSFADKEVQEILQDISELLETLNSYQRIRNLSLNPLTRPAVGPSAGDSTGTPSKPSEAETATYNTLKAQLSLMIAMLPPYAVAKLNSDQLAELSISTKIEVLTDNHKGVMEEDEAAARAKVAEMRAASSSRPAAPVSAHRPSTSLYGNQYSSSPRSSISGGQQYYSQTQTPMRPTSTNMPRPPSTAPGLFNGTRPSSSTSYQPQTGFATPTYPHQLPRTSQTQYGQSTSQQYYRTPAAQSYGQNQVPNYGNLAMTAPQVNPRYQPSNQAAYQQNQGRTQGLPNGMDYRYNTNGSNAARQPSPQKPQPYSPQPHASQPPNRSFGTPTPSLSQGRQYFPAQALTNGPGSISPQPQVAQQSQGSSGHLGATGYHTVMTAEQQATMMERQRAQLAQQQGTQHQARNAAQAGAMSVSPVPQVNGGAVTAGH
jgi:hypothetical protein